MISNIFIHLIPIQFHYGTLVLCVPPPDTHIPIHLHTEQINRDTLKTTSPSPPSPRSHTSTRSAFRDCFSSTEEEISPKIYCPGFGNAAAEYGISLARKFYCYFIAYIINGSKFFRARSI